MSKKIHAGDIVIQSNDLVEAFYDSDLSVTEHKILRFAISKINQNPNSFPHVEFGVKEFLDAAGLKGNNYHSQIEKIGDELIKKRIKVKKNNDIDWFTWLSYLKYRDGVISLAFNTLIGELILELKGQFMKYSFQYIGDMRSSYSIRLLELLKQYATIGRRKIEVNTLKNMLGVADKYPGYGQFKQRVLNQAKKELDRKEGLTFEFEEIKRGRKVHELVFFINLTEKQMNMDDILKEPVLEEDTFIKEAKFLLDNYQFAIPDKVLKEWSKYGINLLNSVLDDVQGRQMDSPVAYIKTVLESKHQERMKVKENLKSESEHANELISAFITEHKSTEVIPDWFLKNKFETYMKPSFSTTEIKELWDHNKDYIMKARNKGNPV